MIMMKKDWNSSAVAKSEDNQKNILRIFDISKIAHTSIENVPTELLDFIRLYWDTYPITGARAMPKMIKVTHLYQRGSLKDSFFVNFYIKIMPN